MTETEQLAAAKSLLGKLSKQWLDFERWPAGDGWVQLDGNADLTREEVDFLSTITAPKDERGPGGLPDDWGDGDE